jgi:hypothetical protein
MRAAHINLFVAAMFALAAVDDAKSQAAPPPPPAVQAPQEKYTPPLPSADYSYPNAGVKIGQGWDSFNERATAASCVEVAEALD